MNPVPGAVGVIETAGGAFIDVARPDSGSITLEGIANSLALECRFVAGSSRPVRYSVATHAVLVARALYAQGKGPRLSLAGLHHDDPEAYLKDMPKPLKPLFEPTYGALTALLEVAIIEALGLPFLPAALHDPAVKRVDAWACAHEAYHLVPSRGLHWADADWPVDGPFSPDPGAEGARAMWLHWHEWLMREIVASP